MLSHGPHPVARPPLDRPSPVPPSRPHTPVEPPAPCRNHRSVVGEAPGGPRGRGAHSVPAAPRSRVCPRAAGDGAAPHAKPLATGTSVTGKPFAPGRPDLEVPGGGAPSMRQVGLRVLREQGPADTFRFVREDAHSMASCAHPRSAEAPIRHHPEDVPCAPPSSRDRRAPWASAWPH